MPQNRLRFGIHDFLNAQPLLLPLRRLAGDRIDIVTDVPSALADRLRSGDLDLAMIPSIEYLREAHQYLLFPEVCIASRGEVGTVLLVSRVPLKKVGSLAVDRRSRTSVALLKILFADKFPPEIEFHPMAPELTTMLDKHDAALIIGDRALGLAGPQETNRVYDLSEEWYRQTGKIFVHAVIAVRSGVALERGMADLIRQSIREGENDLDAVLDSLSVQLEVGHELCKDYLKNKIRYRLDEDTMAGLALFQDLSHQCGLLPEKYPLTLWQAK